MFIDVMSVGIHASDILLGIRWCQKTGHSKCTPGPLPEWSSAWTSGDSGTEKLRKWWNWLYYFWYFSRQSCGFMGLMSYASSLSTPLDGATARREYLAYPNFPWLLPLSYQSFEGNHVSPHVPNSLQFQKLIYYSLWRPIFTLGCGDELRTSCKVGTPVPRSFCIDVDTSTQCSIVLVPRTRNVRGRPPAVELSEFRASSFHVRDAIYWIFFRNCRERGRPFTLPVN
jgi:hypothetical protein